MSPHFQSRGVSPRFVPKAQVRSFAPTGLSQPGSDLPEFGKLFRPHSLLGFNCSRRLDSCLGQQCAGFVHGKADDIGERAVDTRDEGVVVLNPIPAGFPLPFVGRDIAVDFVGSQPAHVDGRDDAIGLTELLCRADDGDAGDDHVGGPAEQREHLAGVVGVFRFAKDAVAERHDRVGGENHRIGKLRGDRFSLFRGQPLREIAGKQTDGMILLVDIGGVNLKIIPGFMQQFPAARGGAGQHKPGRRGRKIGMARCAHLRITPTAIVAIERRTRLPLGWSGSFAHQRTMMSGMLTY